MFHTMTSKKVALPGSHPPGGAVRQTFDGSSTPSSSLLAVSSHLPHPAWTNASFALNGTVPICFSYSRLDFSKCHRADLQKGNRFRNLCDQSPAHRNLHLWSTKARSSRSFYLPVFCPGSLQSRPDSSVTNNTPVSPNIVTGSHWLTGTSHL